MFEMFRNAPLVAVGSAMDVMLSVDELAINPIAIRLWLKRQRDQDFLQKVANVGWISNLAVNLSDVTFLADGVLERNRDRCSAQQFV